ncbi:MAG: molybdopterin-dependent oxidoreductase [Chloroflexi bacterium]|nr:molybdopterin-dependent oxidoreductase [Chloroflexota bacterium]
MPGRRRSRISNGAAFGALIALVLVLLQEGVRVLIGAPTVAELLEDTLIRALPTAALGWILSTLSSTAKSLGFIGFVLVQVVVGAVLGAWLLTRPTGSRPGSPDSQGRRRILVGGLATVAFAFVWFVHRLVPVRQDGIGVEEAAPVDPSWDIAGLPPEVTPADRFYVVSKNVTDPEPSTDGWSLVLSGSVAQPYTISYGELLAVPYEDRYQTLECISNEVGGTLISTAHWRGVRLTDLLDASRPLAQASTVVFRSVDGYAESLPLEQLDRFSPLVAYGMNGQPLAALHGGPVRLVVAGCYGMKSVKWLSGIELADAPVSGYWEQIGWSDGTEVKTMSQIRSVTGQHPHVERGAATLAGVAFAGARPIDRVEVSVDAGRSWSDATLKEPLSPYTWRFWKLDWMAEPGHYAVLVRATDSTGKVQSPEVTDPLPSGASGWDGEPAEVD